jgi:hypothetical protein
MKYLLGLFLMVFVMLAVVAPAQASLIGNDGLQVQEYVYDFSVEGGAVSAIDIANGKGLPVGALIIDVYWKMDTAFTSGGSATVAIGDATNGARYKAATAFDNAAFADEGVVKAAIGVPFKVAAAADGKPAVTVATAALTAGKIRLFVVYMQPKAD